MDTTCPRARAGTYQRNLCCRASYKTPLLSTLNQFDISGEYLGRSFSCPNSPSVPYSLPSLRWNSFTSSLWPTMMERSCFTPSPSWRQLLTWYGIWAPIHKKKKCKEKCKENCKGKCKEKCKEHSKKRGSFLVLRIHSWFTRSKNYVMKWRNWVVGTCLKIKIPSQ